MRFGWDMWTWARLHADAGGHPVFLYRYAQISPYRAGDKYFGWGASHGMEMPYVFDHLDQQTLPWTSQDRRLASVMSTYWTNFAKSGDPNGAGLPVWPAFSASHPLAMQLGEAMAPRPISDEADLSRIDRLYAIGRFVKHHVYAILGVVIIIALGMIAALIRYFLLRRARRRRQAHGRLI